MKRQQPMNHAGSYPCAGNMTAAGTGNQNEHCLIDSFNDPRKVFMAYAF